MANWGFKKSKVSFFADFFAAIFPKALYMYQVEIGYSRIKKLMSHRVKSSKNNEYLIHTGCAGAKNSITSFCKFRTLSEKCQFFIEN